MTTFDFRENDLWYYMDGNEQVLGPLPFNELKAIAATGAITSDTLVCRAGDEAWQSFAIASLPPVPIPPPLPPAPSKPASSSKRVQEYRRTCQGCGKVWHSLMDREKAIQEDIKENKCADIRNCCNPEVSAQVSRNVAAQDSELSRLRRCPECQSANYHEEILTHDAPPTK